MSDSQLPPAPPPAPRPYPYYQPPAREGRSVSFFVALFLALLLVISAGLNVLLLMVSALGSVTGDLGGGVEEDGMFRMVVVGGDTDADHRVLRVPIHGVIGESAMPVLGGRGGMVSEVRRALRIAAKDQKIRAVLFAIDSPGGGVTDSDEIHRLITEFREQHRNKVVYAVLGDMAASGGYYVAVACEQIFARRTTITGSIGVIVQVWNAHKALEKLGIEQVSIVSPKTPHKDMLSPTKPRDPADEAKVRGIVDEMYETFVDVVERGRPNLTREEILKLADGRLYSALQAKSNGLIDDIKNEVDVVKDIQRSDQVGRAQVVELRRVPSLMEALLGVRARPPSLETTAAELLRSATGTRILYWWPGAR